MKKYKAMLEIEVEVQDEPVEDRQWFWTRLKWKGDVEAMRMAAHSDSEIFSSVYGILGGEDGFLFANGEGFEIWTCIWPPSVFEKILTAPVSPRHAEEGWDFWREKQPWLTEALIKEGYLDAEGKRVKAAA